MPIVSQYSYILYNIHHTHQLYMSCIGLLLSSTFHHWLTITVLLLSQPLSQHVGRIKRVALTMTDVAIQHVPWQTSFNSSATVTNPFVIDILRGAVTMGYRCGFHGEWSICALYIEHCGEPPLGLYISIPGTRFSHASLVFWGHVLESYPPIHLYQGFSTWGTRTPGGTWDLFRGYENIIAEFASFCWKR